MAEALKEIFRQVDISVGPDGVVTSHSPIVRSTLLEARLAMIVDNPRADKEIRRAIKRGGSFTVWICKDCPEQELMGIEPKKKTGKNKKG